MKTQHFYPKRVNPCVYIAWNENHCLYVGMSKHGMQRPFTNSTLRKHWKELTKIRVIDCQSVEKAKSLEKSLTERYKPILAKKKGRVPTDNTQVIYLRIPKPLYKRICKICERRDLALVEYICSKLS